MAEGTPRTILLIEDDMLFQTVYRDHLLEEGYVVKLASDGEEALRAMEKSPPDLVLLDLVLPRVSGYEVLARMQANPILAKIPVIVLSNKGEPEDIKRGMEMGAKDYLIKIVAPPKEVLWKIRQALSEKAGQPPAMRVALREKELDASRLAEVAGRSPDLQCAKCGGRLVLELIPRTDQPGWFEAQLVCPRCGK